jgi:hypothetical protein
MPVSWLGIQPRIPNLQLVFHLGSPPRAPGPAGGVGEASPEDCIGLALELLPLGSPYSGLIPPCTNAHFLLRSHLTGGPPLGASRCSTPPTAIHGKTAYGFRGRPSGVHFHLMRRSSHPRLITNLPKASHLLRGSLSDRSPRGALRRMDERAADEKTGPPGDLV